MGRDFGNVLGILKARKIAFDPEEAQVRAELLLDSLRGKTGALKRLRAFGKTKQSGGAAGFPILDLPEVPVEIARTPATAAAAVGKDDEARPGRRDGQRTVIADPDGHIWINPTGTPAMATAGSGDLLTGLISGLAAQFPARANEATLAAAWLHGKAGELAAADLGELPVIATDLLKYLPQALRAAHA